MKVSLFHKYGQSFVHGHYTRPDRGYMIHTSPISVAQSSHQPNVGK